MKVQKINCPNCSGSLDRKISDNEEQIYCPYCGEILWVDKEKKEITINKNIHKRFTDDAKVLKEINKDKKDKRDNKFVFLWFLLLSCMIIIPIIIVSINNKISINQGKISAGYYGDLVGKDYRTVEAHFEAAGFTNIQLIDLDDSGLAIWKNGEVETISVGGDTDFESINYFDSETKVVISYH